MSASKLVPNPEYENALFEGVALDDSGKQMDDLTSSLAFGRMLPARYNQLASGEFVEVPSHIKTP